MMYNLKGAIADQSKADANMTAPVRCGDLEVTSSSIPSSAAPQAARTLLFIDIESGEFYEIAGIDYIFKVGPEIVVFAVAVAALIIPPDRFESSLVGAGIWSAAIRG